MKSLTLLVVLINLAYLVNGNLLYYQEGETGTLSCSGKGEVQFWFLHGKGIAITVAESTVEDTYMNQDGTLSIRRVSKEHHDGNHVCVTKLGDEFKAYSVTMNVKPLAPADLWEIQYRGMFITGLISAVVCLLLIVGSCLVYKYRFDQAHPRRAGESNLVQKSYDNPAMDSEDHCSVKM